MVAHVRPLLVVVLVLSLAAAPAVVAADERFGGTVVVAEGETVDGLSVVAGSVVVHGTVDGDLEGVAGSVRITGTVTGDVDVTAGDVTIAGSVDGDVSVGAGNLAITEDGAVGGDLNVGAGAVAIDGTVRGTVEAGAGSIRLGPGAVVDGDLRYDGDLQMATGAEVGGEVERVPGLGVGPFGGPPQWLLALYGFLANLLLGLVLLALFPRFSEGVADRARDSPLISGAAGLLALVAVPVVLVAIALTIVGIPLSIIGFVLYLLTLWVGAVYGRFAVGAWLLSVADVRNRWLALLVGLVVVAALAWIPIVGGLVEFLVLLVGLGALATAVGGSFRRRRRARTGAPEGTEEPAT